MDISSFSYETQNVHGHIWHIFMKNIHLIGGFNPLKNMSSSDWIIIPNLVGEKKVMFQTTNPVIPLLIPLLINPIINHLPSSPNNHEITIKSPDIYHLPTPQIASGRRLHGLPQPPAAARDPRSSPRRRPGPRPAAPGCPDEAWKRGRPENSASVGCGYLVGF